MLARLRKAQTEDEGFTLIELLVVMIIIGILAAIAIPVFLSQRAKAQDSAAKADVSAIGKEIATYFVDATAAPVSLTLAGTPTRYVLTTTGTTTVDLGKNSNGVSFNNSYGSTAAAAATSATVTGWTANAWCVSVTNPAGSQQTYKYSAQSGLENGNCASATAP